MARVNITKQVKTPDGWRNLALPQDARGRIKWSSGSHVRYIIEWRENGRRLGGAAGVTPAEALEAQRRKRFELEAEKTGLTVLDETESKFPLAVAVSKFLQDIRTFRKPLTSQKYECILELFSEHVAKIRCPRYHSRGHKEVSRLAQVKGL